MSYTTDHDRIAALFKGRSGQIFQRKQIIDIVQRQYPYLARGSTIPSDHDDTGIGNSRDCGCRGYGDHIFDRIGRGIYKVR